MKMRQRRHAAARRLFGRCCIINYRGKSYRRRMVVDTDIACGDDMTAIVGVRQVGGRIVDFGTVRLINNVDPRRTA